MQRLKGKVALVTGASRGGGRGIALVLGEEGATVYVTGRSVRGASTRPDLPGTTIDNTAEQVTTRGGIGIPVRCDHTVDAEVEALFERVKQEHGHLDILVNNAWGGYEDYDDVFDAPFWELSLSRWDKMLKAGVWSTMATTYFAAPLMLPQRQGLVVNTMWDWEPYAGGSLFYYTAKKAIHHMTVGMAYELRPHNIAVVGLVPGWMRTESVMAHNTPPPEEWCWTESVEYVGRAVAALATDSNVMGKAGHILRTRALGPEYGFTDLDGGQPLL
jgi:NAD(P)-dependent dehydrogenase (short-subunit alcohol dehydrogenase family)